MNIKGRNFLTLLDFNKEEIRYLLDLAHQLKEKKKSGVPGEELKGKNIVLIFDKSSTRTRCSFEVAAADEGAHVTFLSNSHMNKKETVEDTAKVFGRIYDAISTGDMGRRLLRRWRNIPVCRCGTVLRIRTIRRRCWRISSPWRSTSTSRFRICI